MRTISAASAQDALTFLDQFGDDRPVDLIELLAVQAIRNPRAVATLAVLFAAMAAEGGMATLATLHGLEPAACVLVLRDAHRRYDGGARHPWVVSGERLYQRNRKRRQRTAAHMTDQHAAAS